MCPLVWDTRGAALDLSTERTQRMTTIETPTASCPPWCGVPQGKHQEEDTGHPGDSGVFHESAPTDSWHPTDEEGRTLSPIDVTVIGFRHDQGGDDWPDTVMAKNTAMESLGSVYLYAEDARRLGLALIRAAYLIDGGSVADVPVGPGSEPNPATAYARALITAPHPLRDPQ